MKLTQIRGRAWAAVVATLALSAFTQSASAATPASPSPGASKTAANVSCKPPSHNQIRCTMTIKGGSALNGTVKMTITQGKVVVARGNGTLRGGKATLTMRVLRKMTPGKYTVTMVATLTSTMVLQVK
jgi:hypothetical protein